MSFQQTYLCNQARQLAGLSELMLGRLPGQHAMGRHLVDAVRGLQRQVHRDLGAPQWLEATEACITSCQQMLAVIALGTPRLGSTGAEMIALLASMSRTIGRISRVPQPVAAPSQHPPVDHIARPA
jgi:hypothetical protein